jgi:hypothetical protein
MGDGSVQPQRTIKREATLAEYPRGGIKSYNYIGRLQIGVGNLLLEPEIPLVQNPQGIASLAELYQRFDFGAKVCPQLILF